MGTRAVITFKDEFGSVSIYQHWDGDPITIVENIARTFASGLCWDWPRWEADEFGAAYVAANKSDGGNIRLTKGPRSHGDLSYSYAVKVVELVGGEKALEVKWKGSASYVNPREIYEHAA